MCLDKVFKTKPKRSGVGYKVFDRRLSGLLTPYQPVTVTHAYFSIADDCQIYNNKGDRYPSGFHLFSTEKAAKSYFAAKYAGRVVRKVIYKKAVAWGRDGGYICIVAKEIKLAKPEAYHEG